MEKFRERRRPLLGLEGYQEGWWVVLDYGDLVIHLFQPEAREFYNLERLWSRAPLVEIRPAGRCCGALAPAFKASHP